MAFGIATAHQDLVVGRFITKYTAIGAPINTATTVVATIAAGTVPDRITGNEPAF